MSVENLGTRAVGPGARFALGAVWLALFGVLSMHGWGTHAGTHGMTAEGAITIVASPHVQTPAHSEMAGRDAGDLSVAGSDEDNTHRAGGEEPSGQGMGWLGLCLAVLGVLLVGVPLVLLLRAVQIPGTLLAAWLRPILASRDRDPPDLLRLCVIRC
jgi:hypothetical protein